MTDEACVLRDVRVMRGNRVGAALSLAVSCACILAFSYVCAHFGVPRGREGASFINVMLMGVLGGGAGYWWSTRVARHPYFLGGELRATAEGLDVAGKRLVSRSDIQAAHVVPGREEGAYVHFVRRRIGAPIDLEVKSVEDGRRLVHALGMDATQATTSFTVAAPSVKHFMRRVRSLRTTLAAIVAGVVLIPFLGGLFVGSGAGGGAVGLAVTVAMLAYAAAELHMRKGATVRVGADGVHVQWLWQKQFIPIHEIVSAEVVQEPIGPSMFGLIVRVHRRGAPSVDILSARGRTGFGVPFVGISDFAYGGAAALAERINEAVSGGGKGASSALPKRELEMLDRGGRSLIEWVEALLALGGKVATFREEATGGVDSLWSVVEDAEAAPAKRAAAAVALVPHLDAQGRQRVRIAAEATVAPKLRIALEAAAEDDQNQLVEALRDLSEAAEEEARAAS